MRTLNFIVDKQTIKPDPECDFGGLYPGTSGYLQARFTFSSEWRGCKKVAAFYNMYGVECEPQVLEDGKTCMIPSSALKTPSFLIQVFGKKGDYRITSNKINIFQNGGN